MEFLLQLLNLTIVIVIGFALDCSLAIADHANAGNVMLSSLIDEAQKNNIEIKEAEKQYEASIFLRNKANSPFLPSLSIEGGYHDGRYDNEFSRGIFLYGQAKYNIYHGGKDKIELNLQDEESQFLKFKIEKIKARVDREVSRKYYELLYLQEGIGLKMEALEANKSQLSLAIKKKLAGFTSQADVLEFELREATLNSDINILKREESTKERDLRLLIGRLDGQMIRVGGHLHRESSVNNIDSLLSITAEESPELKDVEKDIRISNLLKASITGDYLPQVNLEGKYGKFNAEERVSDKANNALIVLQMSIPIFNGLETVSGRKVQMAEIEKNELKASRLRQEIKVKIESSLAKLGSIEERLNLEEKNIERAKKYYEITLNEYKKGVKNSPDVAGAAERLFDAYLRNLEFRKDYFITRLELAEAVGIRDRDLAKI